MFINLDKDFSTYCLPETRPLVYKSLLVYSLLQFTVYYISLKLCA